MSQRLMIDAISYRPNTRKPVIWETANLWLPRRGVSRYCKHRKAFCTCSAGRAFPIALCTACSPTVSYCPAWKRRKLCSKSFRTNDRTTKSNIPVVDRKTNINEYYLLKSNNDFCVVELLAGSAGSPPAWRINFVALGGIKLFANTQARAYVHRRSHSAFPGILLVI